MDDLIAILAKLVPFVIAIIYFVMSKRGGAEEEEVNPEAAERTRRIQEEIRRKIIERQMGGSPTPRRENLSPQTTGNVGWEEDVEEEPVRAAPVVQRVEAPVVTREAPVEEYERRRREIAVQMKRAEELRKKALNVMGKTVSRQGRVAVQSISSRRSIRDELMQPRSLRRAVVLREILDTPVGMR